MKKLINSILMSIFILNFNQKNNCVEDITTKTIIFNKVPMLEKTKIEFKKLFNFYDNSKYKINQLPYVSKEGLKVLIVKFECNDNFGANTIGGFIQDRRSPENFKLGIIYNGKKPKSEVIEKIFNSNNKNTNFFFNGFSKNNAYINGGNNTFATLENKNKILNIKGLGEDFLPLINNSEYKGYKKPGDKKISNIRHLYFLSENN